MGDDNIKVINVAELNRSIILDPKFNRNFLDMDDQPEIVTAVESIFGAIDIPNSSTSIFEHEDTIYLRKILTTLTPDPAYPNADAFNNTLIGEQEVSFQYARSHYVSFNVTITPSENNGYDMSVAVRHDGDYFGKIDASYTRNYYEISPEGTITKTNMVKNTDGFASRLEDQPHGLWTLEATRTFEQLLTRVWDGEIKGFINSTETTISAPPPSLEEAIPLSTLISDVSEGMGHKIKVSPP